MIQLCTLGSLTIAWQNYAVVRFVFFKKQIIMHLQWAPSCSSRLSYVFAGLAVVVVTVMASGRLVLAVSLVAILLAAVASVSGSNGKTALPIALNFTCIHQAASELCATYPTCHQSDQCLSDCQLEMPLRSSVVPPLVVVDDALELHFPAFCASFCTVKDCTVPVRE